MSSFTRNFPQKQQSAIEVFLKLITFEMILILLAFGEKCFEYGDKGI